MTFLIGLWTKVKTNIAWIGVILVLSGLTVYLNNRVGELKTDLAAERSVRARESEAYLLDSQAKENSYRLALQARDLELAEARRQAEDAAIRARMEAERELIQVELKNRLEEIRKSSLDELVDRVNQWVTEGVL
jgi:hypothetical protein